MNESVLPSSLLGIPSELLLHILSFISIEDVLAIRQSCNALEQITRVPSLWLAFYKEQMFLLNRPTQQSSKHAQSLEFEVIAAHRIAKSWSKPRASSPIQLHSSPSEPLLEMKILSDRWLLCVFCNSQVNVWDLYSPAPTLSVSAVLPCLVPNIRSAPLTDAAAATDPAGKHILLALNYAPGLPTVTQIYRIKLPSSEPDAQNQVQPLRTLLSHAVRSASSIEPVSGHLLFSGVIELDIVDINDLDSPSPNLVGEAASVTQRISPHGDDMEELTNSIVSSRIMGPFVILFKFRTIELYLLKTSGSSIETESSRYNDYIQRFQFPSITVRTYSISDPVIQHDYLSFSFFGSDFLHGIFLFDVLVHYTSTSLIDASLHVDCVGVYALAEDLNLAALLPLPPLKRSRSITSSQLSLARSSKLQPQTNQTNRDLPIPSLAPEPALTRHPGIFGLPNNSSSGIPRGFIGAMVMGPQGKRAVWIERKRGSTIREVLVWSRQGLDVQDASQSNEEAREVTENGFDIPQNVIYRIHSYDLREDLKHCAIAEVSGIIALGNRMGEVFVLQPT